MNVPQEMMGESSINDKTETVSNPLDKLALADPELAAEIAGRLAEKPVPVPTAGIEMLVEETLWAISQEISFGYAVGRGMSDLAGEVTDGKLQQFSRGIREAGGRGPTIGVILATYLAPVLKHGDDQLVTLFVKTVDIMLAKGTYTLAEPLAALARLLNSGNQKASSGYLKLLRDIFSKNISYNQSQHFSRDIPAAIHRMTVDKITWQIFQIRRAAQCDVRLVRPFLAGMDRGLAILSESSLAKFVTLATEKFLRNHNLAMKFLSLESRLGIDTFTGMQITVPLSQVRAQLNRYMRARVGKPISIRPLSSAPKSLRQTQGKGVSVCSDGRSIFLPDEISSSGTRAENLSLYKILTRLEAGLFEFGTFGFDLERAVDRYHDIREKFIKPGKDAAVETESETAGPDGGSGRDPNDRSDLERFFNLFPDSRLAAELFTVFEHGRLRVLTAWKYPGLARASAALLGREAAPLNADMQPAHPLQALYNQIALGIAGEAEKADLHFRRRMAKDATVEACAALTAEFYDGMLQLSNNRTLPESKASLKMPFGRRIRPDAFYASFLKNHRIADQIKKQLAAVEVRVYKSDLIRSLIENHGVLSLDEIGKIAAIHQAAMDPDSVQAQNLLPDLSRLDLSAFFAQPAVTLAGDNDLHGKVFWYREWDHRLEDYLPDHVRVTERQTPPSGNGFYGNTLLKHSGLVKKIRFAFELLKPEGLSLLRRWPEGDEFDYRALLDFAIDKKRGHTPSERLYNKRVKNIREVAVLLLIDLSRSTSNRVSGSRNSVLHIEKEGVVLFCEALQVVGDTFAIAGFSGTGRLGVDYCRIKDFDEPLEDAVRERISALSPLRNTRMGSAIRHATTQLEAVPARVRLMMILGDGFPNDTDYKRDYAIADTRKAIQEAGSKNIYSHAITVNLGADGKLDDLYGKVHHSVISDVRELPDKLPQIYGTLTRQ